MTSNAEPCSVFPRPGADPAICSPGQIQLCFLAPLTAIPLATISKETRYYQISLPREKKRKKEREGKTDGGALRITIYLEKKEGAG